jgi:hypothetical protein
MRQNRKGRTTQPAKRRKKGERETKEEEKEDLQQKTSFL